MGEARILLAGAVVATIATMASSQDDNVTLSASFTLNGKEQTITQSALLDPVTLSQFFKPAENCSGVCIAPIRAAAGVETVGEREVLAFVTSVVARGAGLLLDSRNPEERSKGFIATSVNVPVALLAPDNPFLGDILTAMGGESRDGAMSFEKALPVIVFDDGPTTSDAPNLINALISAGYPTQKIKYYRGGMQVWAALGLSIEN